jgi:hypothetical protein
VADGRFVLQQLLFIGLKAKVIFNLQPRKKNIKRVTKTKGIRPYYKLHSIAIIVSPWFVSFYNDSTMLKPRNRIPGESDANQCCGSGSGIRDK